MLLITAEKLFGILIKSSVAAGIAAAVVFAARAAIRKAPKRWAYMMWAVVFFRCLCPFAAESGISVFNIFRFGMDTSGAGIYDTLPGEYGASEESPETGDIHADTTSDIRNMPDIQGKQDMQHMQPQYEQYEQIRRETHETRYYRDGMDVQPTVLDGESVSPAAELKSAGKSAGDGINTGTVFIIVWFCGAMAMALYGVISASRLAARVKTAVRTEEGVYESDRIATAFTAGILRPRIYIPCGIPENERRLIVMHERVHIRRRDYLVKLLAFAGLSLHWFNPLIWAAFSLMTRDMEMSCDEAVLKKCGSGDRIPYAEALLRVSVKGFGPAAVVGFGETGIKGRVKNVLNYKKPSRLAAVLAAALMLASCAAAGTDAVTDNADGTESTESTDSEDSAGSENAAEAYLGTRLEKGTTVKSETGGADTADASDAGGNGNTNAEHAENGDGFDYYIGLYDRNFALALREPFVVISLAGDVVNDNGTVWLIPVDKTAGVKGMGAEKFIINRNRVVTATFRIHCGDTVVKAPVDGEVLWADGFCVVLDTEYGAVTYGDMKDVELKAGDKVSKLDALGKTAGSGYTGYAVQASITEIPDSARFLNYYANAGVGSYTYSSSEARLLGGESVNTGLLKPINVNDMTEWFNEGDFYGSNINYNFLSGFADLSEMAGREKLVKKQREQEAKLTAEEIRLKQKEAELRRLSEEAAKAAQSADNSEAVLVKPCPADAEISEPYNAESADGGMHNGIDYRVDQGTEIYAAAGGKIISCDDKQNGYGTCIIIDHGGGLMTVYAHLSKSLVSPENEVSAGELIGYSGHTGNAFGNHLHFEVRQDGQHVDPLPYLKN